MANRYERVFTLQEDLYAEGSPVIIRAGALLKDTVTGGILTQLKFKNADPREIRALTVSIRAFDTAGRGLGEVQTYQYLDLTAKRDAEFGQKTAVPMNDLGTRSVSVSVAEVVFADASVWTAGNAEWKQLAPAVTLSDALQDAELLKQYRIQHGRECTYAPSKVQGLWYCACGQLNRQEEAVCHACGKSYAALADSLTSEALKADRDARLEAERKAAEEKAEAERIAAEKRAEAERKAAEERRIKAEKTKKIISITAPIAVACVAIVLLVTKVFIPNSKYNAAVKLYDAGQYEEAIASFKAMDGYKDSDAQIENCRTAIKDIDYNAALDLFNEGKYKEAIAAFKAVGGYKDSDAQIENCNTAIKNIKYNAALDLFNEGKYEEAITAFKAIGGYKDSDAQIENCYIGILGEELYTKMKNAKVGYTFTFGSYEQDNNSSNGTEAIEWLVLDKQDDKVLVISKYALDCQKYNSSATDVTWESCSLRTWLNGTFLNNAFSADEQAKIATTTVSADKNPRYRTNPGNATNDKIFLLSITEAKRYFTTYEACKCAPTAYAIEQGAYTNDNNKTASGEATCSWWLRSPGDYQDYAAYVLSDGSVYYYGIPVRARDCVRPALWINHDY